MQEQILDFIKAMQHAGCAPHSLSDVVADDKIHRYRIEGDAARTTNGAYKLAVQHDGFAVGWFRNWRDGVTHSWHSKAKRDVTPDQRKVWKEAAERAKAERIARDALAHANAARRASRMLAAMPRATGQEEYLQRKQVQAHGVRVMGDCVIVPVVKDGATVGLQIIQPDGTKRFMKGMDCDGGYFSIAKRTDSLDVIAIVEGFATGATVREAMGWPVIVAFNAGNLVKVAKSMRAKYPDAQLVIAGDNDQWTVVKGKPVNPGRDAAMQAAASVGGAHVMLPEVPADDEMRRTDWNDIACTDGIDAVRDGLTLRPAAPVQDVQDAPDDDWQPDYDAVADTAVTEDDPLDVIRPLGHDRGTYYFFPRTSGQIVDLTASSMGRMQNLYRLAPRGFWERYYGNDGKASDSDITAYASAHLIEECHRKGVFQSDNVRGVGAWVDGSQVVVNCGDVVWHKEGTCHPSDFKSKAVYEAGPRVIDLDYAPLSNKEAARLLDICKRLTWKRPQFAALLAGWIVVAGVGGALTWRPHIVVTGPAGSGKSTAMEDIVKACLGRVSVNRDGGTTEAGMRKALGASGRPFVMDEAESENQQARQEMAKIFFAARRSSSGGVVENANATFQLRSCFCFAAINPRIEQRADNDRITSLELVPDRTAGADERFADLQRTIIDVITPDFPGRLMARTVRNIDALLANVETFTLAASKMLGSRRDGDQLGPLIAGAYSLTSTRKISRAEADAWIAAQDWDWHVAAKDVSDAEKLLQTIMTARVRYDDNGMGRESSIGELVAKAAYPASIGQDAATKGLASYGIRVKDGLLMIANSSPPLKKVLFETPWAVWARTLGDIPGAGNADNRAVYFGPGWTSKVTTIPLGQVMDMGGAAMVAQDDDDLGLG